MFVLFAFTNFFTEMNNQYYTLFIYLKAYNILLLKWLHINI